MSYIRSTDGTRIHYRITGRSNGAPILFIQGLGADKNGWNLQRLATAPWYRGIALDNRGAGRSDKPHGPYSLEQMADDAIAVLDDAGEETAHVVGASMGGAISQIVAVKYPERTRSLTLACTAGRNHPWREELLGQLARRGVGARNRLDGPRRSPLHDRPTFVPSPVPCDRLARTPGTGTPLPRLRRPVRCDLGGRASCTRS